MRLLINYAKLGLALLAPVVPLGGAAVARADQASGAMGTSQAAGQAASRTLTRSSTAGSIQPAEAAGSTGGAPAETKPPDAGPGGADGGSATTPPESAGATLIPDPSSQTALVAGAVKTAGNPAQTVSPDRATSSDPVQPSAAQAVQDYQSQPTTNAPNPGPAASSATTTQKLLQVQVAGCTAYCQGTSQRQAALQQNTTVQVLGAPPQDVPGTGTPVKAGDASHPESAITQIQFGCLSHCFGITTTSTGLSDGLDQGLKQLLSMLAPKPGGSNPPLAVQQSLVDQSAYQWQQGAQSQTQLASQTSTTVQVVDAASTVAAAVGSALGSSYAAPADAINHTEQGIWQLQVGCLIFCAGTQQSQEAQQSNETIEVGVVSGTGSEATTAVASFAKQLIWQLQIGCLFWCYNATEDQRASGRNTLSLIQHPTSAAGGGGDPSSPSAPPQAPAPAPSAAPQAPAAAAPTARSNGGTRPNSSGAVPVPSPSTTGFMHRGSHARGPQPSPRDSILASGNARGSSTASSPGSAQLPPPSPLAPQPTSSITMYGATFRGNAQVVTSSIISALPTQLTSGSASLALPSTPRSAAMHVADRRMLGWSRPSELSPWSRAIFASVGGGDPGGGAGLTLALVGTVAILLCVSSVVAIRRAWRRADRVSGAQET